MVPEEDRAKVDEAMRAIAGLIIAPERWKASWRRHYEWQGLPTRKSGELDTRRSG